MIKEKVARFHRRINRVIFVLIFLFVLFPFTSSKISAAVFSCEVSVNPHTTTRETSTVYSFSADSASYTGAGIKWFKVSRPSGEFTITQGTATGWSATINETDVVFTNAASEPPPSFTIYATSGTSDADSADWVVEMSSTEAGDNPRTCTGNLGTSISGSSSVSPTPTPTFTPIPDITAPTITNVTISGVSENSVTITWNINENANARINYGTTTSYGSDKSNSEMKTSHSITLTGLSTNTTYHGQILSADSAGNTAVSNDFTFATSQTVTTVTVTTTVTTVITPTPTPTPTPDLVPPKVTLTTDVDKIFTSVPAIEGSATDNVGISKVEYSIDDGKNWAKADQVNTLGEKKVTFSFTPLTQGDGSYFLKVRVFDAGENKAETQGKIFIIDRLPPIMGGALFSLGSQVLEPSPDGSFFTIAGLSPKLTLSAVGGATSIDLKVDNQRYPLVQNQQTRLWSAGFILNEPGQYALQLNASDSAKNQTSQLLPILNVLPNGVISDSVGPVENAKLRVHYFDAPSQSFRLWGAEQYGQENPSLTDSIGRYKLMLPPGTYFIDITSPSTRPLKTNIFTITRSTPITENFFLTKKTGLRIANYTLSFPDFGQNNVIMNTNTIWQNEARTSSLIGQTFPDFNLDGVTQNSIKGEPHLVTVLTTWLPQTAAQMKVIQEAIGENKKALVIMSQESSASVNVFAKRGEYQIPVISDPDGVLITPLQLKSLPTHYFLDRRGVITNIMTGMLSREEILENYSN